MDEYTKKVMYFLENQKFNRKLKDYTKLVTFKSLHCGDFVDIYIKIDENSLEILDLGYFAQSCALNLASLEIFCDYLIGKNFDEISNLSEEMLKKELDFPEHKQHCVSLTLDCFKKLKE